MKVIFLDVDGVLNSMQDGYSFELETNKHFELLKQIIDKTNAKLVLSSSWRIGIRPNDTIHTKLKEFGMSIYDCTPILKGKTRGDEIQAWLDQHQDVERFIILDDDIDMGKLMYRLVHTDTMVGLTEEEVKICLMLMED